MKIFKALLVVSLIACNAEGGEEFNLKKIDNLIGSWHKETSTYYFLDGAKTEFDKSKNEELVYFDNRTGKDIITNVFESQFKWFYQCQPEKLVLVTDNSFGSTYKELDVIENSLNKHKFTSGRKVTFPGSSYDSIYQEITLTRK